MWESTQEPEKSNYFHFSILKQAYLIHFFSRNGFYKKKIEEVGKLSISKDLPAFWLFPISWDYIKIYLTPADCLGGLQFGDI